MAAWWTPAFCSRHLCAILSFASAKHRGQYIRKWSGRILKELAQNLTGHRKLSSEKITHLIGQMEREFPEAEVKEYEKLIGAMANDPAKDRHVAAAAIQSGTRIIVTFNLKDFPAVSRSDWDIEAHRPDEFLINILSHRALSFGILLAVLGVAELAWAVNLRTTIIAAAQRIPALQVHPCPNPGRSGHRLLVLIALSSVRTLRWQWICVPLGRPAQDR